jgi:DNA-directed RNA polymerase specialized sigma24 family protein
MTATQRDESILMLIEQARPYVQRYAAKWHLSSDDLFQSVSTGIVSLVNRAPEISNMAGYLSRIAHNQAVRMVQAERRHAAFSFDTRALPESEITLADLLPSPYSTDPASVLLARERLERIEKAVKHLPGRHGIAVRSRYETVLATYC